MSMDDIWAAGRSTSKRAWLTNPSRNGFFIMARPYLAEICRKIDKTIGERIEQGVRAKASEKDPKGAQQHNPARSSMQHKA